MRKMVTSNSLHKIVFFLAVISVATSAPPAQADEWNAQDATAQQQAAPTVSQPAAPAPLMAVPDVPTIMPPDLPPRPPLTVAPQPPVYQPAGNRKVALAWRSKASQLRDSMATVSTSFRASYESALMNLISTLPRFGLRVSVLNSKAGEVLVAPADSTQPAPTYLFTLNEMPPSVVTIKAAPMNSAKAAQSGMFLQTLLDTVAKTPSAKGVYQ